MGARSARKETNAPAAPRARGRPAPLLLLAAVVLATGGYALWRGGSSVAAPDVPDPVTPEMLSPVRRALTAAREAVLADPDASRTWGEFAETCDAHHLYPEAEAAYRRAAALEPREFRWAYGLALVRDFQGGESAEVARLFDAAIRLEPRYPPARLRAGDALVRQGRLEEACRAYEEALVLDPGFALAHRGLGQTRLALDQLDEALRHLEQAAELDPADGVTQNSLAEAYRRSGDELRASQAVEAGRTRAPVFAIPDPVRFALEARNVTPLACEQRAREAEEHGRWSAALPDLERLVETSATDVALRWRLGRCLAALGRTPAARSELARALELEPRHPGSLWELAALEEQAGELERAVALYRRASAELPGEGRVWKRLGTCLGPLGDLEGALEAFERAAALAPPDAELLHNWGTALARADRHAEACQRLERALELEPRNAGAHLSLGASLALLGRRTEALAHYERAQALDASLPVDEALRILRVAR
jgi:tetratricopeptide (TPR) repeat protein